MIDSFLFGNIKIAQSGSRPKAHASHKVSGRSFHKEEV